MLPRAHTTLRKEYQLGEGAERKEKKRGEGGRTSFRAAYQKEAILVTSYGRVITNRSSRCSFKVTRASPIQLSLGRKNH